MMYTACSGIEDVPLCFSISPVKFQIHTAQKMADFDNNWAFSDFRHKSGALLFFRSSVKFQGQRDKKKIDFDPNLAIIWTKHWLSSLMAHMCVTSTRRVIRHSWRFYTMSKVRLYSWLWYIWTASQFVLHRRFNTCILWTMSILTTCNCRNRKTEIIELDLISIHLDLHIFCSLYIYIYFNVSLIINEAIYKIWKFRVTPLLAILFEELQVLYT